MLLSNLSTLMWLLCLCSSLLSGCAVYDAPNQAQQWLNQENAMVLEPPVQVFPVPHPVVPQVYLPPAAGSPFSTERIGRAWEHGRTPSAQSPGMAFEWQRPPQPLERFPLDSMVMVGVLEQAGTVVALVRANETIHAVHQGQYLGQNFGLIKVIQPHAIQLREMVQDPNQQWVERVVTLQLQEENHP